MDCFRKLFCANPTLRQLERQEAKLVKKLNKNGAMMMKTHQKSTSARSDRRRETAQRKFNRLHVQRGLITVTLDIVKGRIIAEKASSSSLDGTNRTVNASYDNLSSAFPQCSTANSHTSPSIAEDIKLASSLLLLANMEDNNNFTLL